MTPIETVRTLLASLPAGLDLSKLSRPDAAAITRLVGTLSRLPKEK